MKSRSSKSTGACSGTPFGSPHAEQQSLSSDASVRNLSKRCHTGNVSPADLTIIVVHYRTPALLRDCLARLERYASPAKLLVVDTGPAHERVEEETLGVKVLEARNHSLAHAVNVGLKEAVTPFIAHMNADVMVGPETYPKLLEALQTPDVGMVGPVAHTPLGRPQPQGPLYRLHHGRLARSTRSAVTVPWLSGCLQVLKREVLERVGGMNASLRFYNEDMEWCWRIRGAGYRCKLVGTEVLHLGGASTPPTPHFLVEGYRGGYRLSQMYRPTLYRAAHRRAVLTESAWRARHSRDPVQRSAYERIHEMFRQETFFESPFGETLEETNSNSLEAL